jgi:hypothetical protein
VTVTNQYHESDVLKLGLGAITPSNRLETEEGSLSPSASHPSHPSHFSHLRSKAVCF